MADLRVIEWSNRLLEEGAKVPEAGDDEDSDSSEMSEGTLEAQRGPHVARDMLLHVPRPRK